MKWKGRRYGMDGDSPVIGWGSSLAESGDVCFWLLRLPYKPFYAFIHNPQVFPFHLVIQKTITNKFRGQFWNLHILVKHSLYTCIGQSYLCAKSFKVYAARMACPVKYVALFDVRR